jgi:hypothetical protein
MVVESGYCRQDRKAGAGSTFGVVVMRLGIAEVGHHAVAKVLRDIPAETFDCVRRRAMVLADDFAPLLEIEMAGDLGRSNEIAKKHRQMPSLSSDIVLGVLLNVWARLNRRGPRSRSIERRSAVVTKLGSGFVVCAAARTFFHYRRSASDAKLRSFGIFRRAFRAAHRPTRDQ